MGAAAKQSAADPLREGQDMVQQPVANVMTPAPTTIDVTETVKSRRLPG